MLKVKCIQKFRDKNNIIIGYRIMDQNGNTKDVSSESLKQVIEQGKLEVINLTLTSDNRLIDKGITQTPTKQTQKPIKKSYQKTIDIDKMLLRLKLLGYAVTEIETSSNHKIYLIKMSEEGYKIIIQDQDGITEIKSSCITEIDEGCGHTIYLAKMSEENYILIIPDDVTGIRFDIGYYHNEPTPINRIPIGSSNAKLTVYGGNNLKIAKNLFARTEFKTIDLSKLNTSKVTDMSWMFYCCQAKSIDLSSFDTSSVINMQSMFYWCKATSLGLSSFDTSKVTNMGFMFCNCQATSLDLSSFNTSKVTNMNSMFNGCQATSLDLSSFNTSKVTDMWRMFYRCQATSLDLSSFNTSSLISKPFMFGECKATSINFGRNKDLELAWNSR